MIGLVLLMVRLSGPFDYADLPTEQSVVWDGWYLCYEDGL